ncbi:MAG: PPOX class F420-dependent oxidoreductase [Euzebya sp.]
MDLSDATPFLTEHNQAVIVTVGQEEVPHASNVMTHFDGEIFRVSLTSDRVKTHNLQRRPLAVLHLTSADFWKWVAVECDAELTPVTTRAGDAVGEELRDLYEDIRGGDSAPEDFLQSMVDANRLVLRLTPRRVYGQLG